MIEVDVPGRGRMQFEHLVSDVNGTLALDGELISGVAERIARLKDRLTVHLLTADTHGKQAEMDRILGLTAVRVELGGEATQKAAFVRTLGAAKVIALGQGANDAEMLAEAALGICVISPEGAASESLHAAVVVVPDILAAFDLIDHPRRLVATLRK